MHWSRWAPSDYMLVPGPDFNRYMTEKTFLTSPRPDDI